MMLSRAGPKIVALALDEPAAAKVEATLRRGDCAVSAVILAEALDQLGRVHGHGAAELGATFAPVLDAALAVVAALALSDTRGRRP